MSVPKFSTKKEMLDFFRAMINRHRDGETIPAPDADALHWLISLHPEAKHKIGNGIARFFIQPNPPFGTRGFQLERLDGSITDFSFLVCVNGQPSDIAEVNRAMRSEVGLDISLAKREYFEQHANDDGKIPCAETGKLISFEEAHADHLAPLYFSVLVRCFWATEPVPPRADMVNPTSEGRRLTDRELARRWVAFHHRVAEIRLVDGRVNTLNASKSKIQKGQLRLPKAQP